MGSWWPSYGSDGAVRSGHPWRWRRGAVTFVGMRNDLLLQPTHRVPRPAVPGNTTGYLPRNMQYTTRVDWLKEAANLTILGSGLHDIAFDGSYYFGSDFYRQQARRATHRPHAAPTRRPYAAHAPPARRRSSPPPSAAAIRRELLRWRSRRRSRGAPAMSRR